MTDSKALAKKRPGRSLDDFRAAHDKNYIVPAKVKAALESIGDGWEYQVDFLRIAGLSTTDLAAFRDQFEDHIVVTKGSNPKLIWVGNVKTAQKMREMV
jgi:hypothetical protein